MTNRERIQANNLKIQQLIRKVMTKQEGIVPVGTIHITENGIYDVTEVASANVNIEATGGGTNFMKYHIEEQIHEDTNTVDLIITDYAGQENNNYMIGEIINGDTSDLYIVNI